MYVYIWLSPFAVHLKLSQHCPLAMPQYKIKSLILKRRVSKGRNPILELV